jgi:hypothetical protein
MTSCPEGELRLAAENVLREGTRVVFAPRHTPPLRVGLVGLQSECQDTSATVTNPVLTPVETNANL